MDGLVVYDEHAPSMPIEEEGIYTGAHLSFSVCPLVILTFEEAFGGMVTHDDSDPCRQAPNNDLD